MAMTPPGSALAAPPVPSSADAKYRAKIVEDELGVMKEAQTAGDIATVRAVGQNVAGELSGTTVPRTYSDQIKAIVSNPSPDEEDLDAAQSFMQAYNKRRSVLTPAAAAEYSSSDLSSMAGGDGSLGSSPLSQGSSAQSSLGGDAGSFGSSPQNSPSQSSPSLSNLPQVG